MQFPEPPKHNKTKIIVLHLRKIKYNITKIIFLQEVRVWFIKCQL